MPRLPTRSDVIRTLTHAAVLLRAAAALPGVDAATRLRFLRGAERSARLASRLATPPTSPTAAG